MKNLNYFFLLVLSIFSVCCFTSCGGDDGPLNPSGLSASISPSSLTLDTESASALITLNVQGEGDVHWELISDAQWLTATPNMGTAGTFTVEVSSFGNFDEDQNATLTLVAKDYYNGNEKKTSCAVTQKCKEILVLTQKDIQVSKFGGEYEIGLKSNIEYSYVIEDDAKGWVHVSTQPLTRVLKDSFLYFLVDENYSSEREGHITITGDNVSETITFIQSKGEGEVSVHVANPGDLKNMISEGRLYSIESITISGSLNDDDLKVIGKMENLRYIDLENADLKYIGNYPLFPYRTDMTLILPKNLKGWECVFANYHTYPLVGSVKLPDGIETVNLGSAIDSKHPWGGISNIYVNDVDLFFRENFKAIGLFSSDSKMYCNKKLVTNIVVPDGTKQIGQNLRYYSNLVTISIPSSVEKISWNAFQGSSIKIMEINSFEHWARVFNSDNTPFTEDKPGRLLYKGKNVESVEIPTTITEINGAYYCVEGIKEVHCRATTPPKVSIYYDFNMIDQSTTILYVPKGSKQKYNLSDWGALFQKIVEE